MPGPAPAPHEHNPIGGPPPRIARRRFLAGVGGTATAAVLSACSSSSAPQVAATSQHRRYGGTLAVGLTGGGNTDTLDPHQAVNITDTARTAALYEPLVRLNPAAGPEGAALEYVLATEMTPNSTATEWIIKLRPGVRFHDGTPLAASDVVYTLQRIIRNKFSGANVLGPVDESGIRATGPLTVAVPMSHPFSTLPEQIAGILTEQIVPQGFTASTRPNGTGPFKYQSFTPGRRSLFVRNGHYWRPGLPYAGALEITDFPDLVSLEDALITGRIQAAGTLEGPQMATLANTSGITPLASQAGLIVPFTMRVDQAPFSDVRVRQALRLAVDRPQLIDSALDARGLVANDVFSPWDDDFDKSLVRHTDIEQAKFLLRQAGRENLHIQLVTSQIATGAIAMATVLAEQVKAAGISVSLRPVDSATFFGSNYLKWPFAQDFYSYTPYLTQVTLSMLPTSPWDETHWADPAYIKLYAQANATLNPSLRREIIWEMQKTDFDRGGYIIPAFVNALDAYSNKITGYHPSRIGQPVSDLDFAPIGFR